MVAIVFAVQTWGRGGMAFQAEVCVRAETATMVRNQANKLVDFNRGPTELVEAIREKRPCRLSGELALHMVEISEALQYPERFGGKRTIHSTFDPIQPLPWST